MSLRKMLVITVFGFAGANATERLFNEAACIQLSDTSKIGECKVSVKASGHFDFDAPVEAPKANKAAAVSVPTISSYQEPKVWAASLGVSGESLESAGFHSLIGTALGIAGGILLIVSKGDSDNMATYVSYGCLAASFGFQIAVPFDLMAAGKAMKSGI